MSAVAREAEVDRVTTAFHLALTKIGVDTVEEALVLWESVPVDQRGDSVKRWLADAIHLVMTKRGQSRELAVAYYRLARALVTGRTVPDPRQPEKKSVTLAELRYEFSKLTDGKAPKPQEGGEGISIEDIDWNPLEEATQIDRDAHDELVIDLTALGPDNLNKKIDGIDDGQPASEVDKARQQAHTEAGARQAAAASRIAQNGARSEVWNLMRHDKRALGWARVSTTGTPCGWCAMLISRGAVYRSESSAMYAEGDLYHDNCNCIAVPIFSREQYQSSRFDLNRRYQKEWPEVTKGLSGKAALSAWRRYIRQTQKAAQAAAASTNVQEA